MEKKKKKKKTLNERKSGGGGRQLFAGSEAVGRETLNPNLKVKMLKQMLLFLRDQMHYVRLNVIELRSQED